MSVVAGVRGALPPHRYSQEEITEAFARWPGFDQFEDILRRLHASCNVNSRHLVLPLEVYPELRGFDESNDLFIEHAVELGSQALADALDEPDYYPRMSRSSS